ncbi:DNA mismatch repair protein MLH3 [Prosopis cineraria]|uniref:DNA mismatch repair protein MLH3 n=1 Tax=Prosopis cineraria TaxID=364024 RepID=UPI00240F31A7|nr:DNA mismatch repair protein MLH3 [Prosopis cineraria]
MTSIRPLSDDVRSSLRSGIFLFDLTRVVEELVFNSLDAGATKVSVFVSVRSCYIKVADDGVGITRDGLTLVGERYATSKLLSLADLNATSGHFGFRGEALASISEVSLLEILTRTFGRANGYRKLLKGCKCLYLGIDDDRKEVGTTVVARDLFHNQPVRRKYMQSSPKKVLQSVKKCMLRLALVRPNVLFKVVDIESEDELLCTHSSSSPLSLLTSGFGVEVSSSLHELQDQDDVIKLSGYISGPCNNFTLKALQYIYINSQFISKGPIHKLLSQLAVRFEHQDSQNAGDKFQNKKRSRSQAYPAYILNLLCPRSLYDLTFEPSKTSVQFRDWTSVLNFIEKAIKNFWGKNITHGGYSNATHVVQAGQPSNEIDNVILAEADIVNRGNQKRKEFFDIFFSTSARLAEDHHCLSDGQVISRSSLGYLPGDAAKFKEKQNKRGFLCQTGYSNFSMDGSFIKCGFTVTKNNCSMWNDNYCLSGRDDFLDGEFAAGEIFTGNVSFDAPRSTKGNKFLEVDDDMLNESSQGALHYGCNELCNDVEIDRDFQKPFLKSCSARGSILHEKALFANDEHEFQIDGFSSKQDLGMCGGRVENLGAHPYPEVVEIFSTSRDSVFLSRASTEETCFPSDSCSLATQMGCRRFVEETCFPSNSSHLELSTLDHYPIFKTPLLETTSWGDDLMTGTDLDVLGGIPRCYKWGGYKKNSDANEKRCNCSCDILYRFNSDQCMRSFGSNRSHFDGAYNCNNLNFTKWPDPRLVKWPNCYDIDSNKLSDILTDESDWLCPVPCGESYQRLSKNRMKKDCVRHLASEKNHERSRRSFSAPPFHKSKRRFNSLNQHLAMMAKRLASQTSSFALKKREADEECPPESFGPSHPSPEEYLLLENNSIVKQKTSTLGYTQQVNSNKEFDWFQSFNSQSNAPFKELTSRKVEDSMDYRTKWRNYSPEIPTRDKALDFHSQDDILDISSGFLHLAGDSLVPETISKNCLQNARVLHQVDKKFIPVVAGRTLAVIDQHAADERIRLEELRQKVLSGEAKTINYLDAEQELVLPEIGYQLLHSYSEQIKDWGWICNVHAQDSKSFKQNLDILNKQPAVVALIAVPCILGVNLNDIDLMEFLQQLADTDGSSTVPPSVVRVLNLKACRGAIMFGDSLLPSECSLIVEELKQTSLCFQCAHGRPTTVPLVNLEALHTQIAKLGPMIGCSNDEWHGLRRHKISVERAAQRSCSSGE